MTDLKPCPCCGDNNLSTGWDGLLRQHYICCIDCDLTIYGSKTGVKKSWNTRAVDAEVKRLREALEWIGKQDDPAIDGLVDIEDLTRRARETLKGGEA